jgi:pimeloyl-ACP methyl ester carboxylesterase
MRANLIVRCALVGLLMTACASKSGGVKSVESKTVDSATVDSSQAVTTPTVEITAPPATAASTPETDPVTVPETQPPATGDYTLTLESCGDGIECGTIDVPVDYEDPTGPQFTLYAAVHLATDAKNRIGSLLVNPGGPGFGGSDFAVFADQIYGPSILERFDIVAWDPRGTGESTPAIDCIEDYDRYFASTDITPDDDAERQQIIDLAKEFEELCATKNAEILQFIGTNNSARDMDAIRQALGEDKISYFGFSYGSELGATWATLFPDTVRAAVLDGASDPNAPALESGLQQVRGFEASIASFLKQCSENSSCVFNNNGDAEGAFDALMLALDETPVPSNPGRPDIGRGVALSAVAEAMYSQSSWPDLEQALADAQDGNGSGLLDLYDQYYQRGADGVYDNSLEAFQTISCMDSDERLTVEEDDATAPQFIDAGPRFAPGSTGSYFCSFYPQASDPRVVITGAGAGPIVVVGTTGDPATPLASSENMTKALEGGVLVVVVADQHTGYGVNSCVNDAVDQYLVDLVVPENGLRCE